MLHRVSQRAKEAQEDYLRAKVKIGPVIRYWLDQTCPRCNGRRFQVLPGTSRLSNKTCPPPTQGGCGGSGVAPVPMGQDGRKLANHMDECAHRYRQRMSARKKAFQSIPPIDKLSKRMQPQGSKTVDPEAD